MAKKSVTDKTVALQLLLDGQSVEFKAWSFGWLDGYIWATNPYGIDVSCFEPDEHKIERALVNAELDNDKVVPNPSTQDRAAVRGCPVNQAFKPRANGRKPWAEDQLLSKL